MIVITVVFSATESLLELSSQMQQHDAILAWPTTGTNLHKNKTQTDDKRMRAEKQSTDTMCLSVRNAVWVAMFCHLSTTDKKQTKQAYLLCRHQQNAVKERTNKKITDFLSHTIRLANKKSRSYLTCNI